MYTCIPTPIIRSIFQHLGKWLSIFFWSQKTPSFKKVLGSPSLYNITTTKYEATGKKWTRSDIPVNEQTNTHLAHVCTTYLLLQIGN